MLTTSDDAIRVPGLWAVVGILTTPVAIGLLVFLRRYRGADRTAMALGTLVGIGLCAVVGLAWFQRRFGGTEMSRRRLQWIGFRCGGVAGMCAWAVAVILLGVRWAIDQMGGPVGEPFIPAFLRALMALWVEMFTGRRPIWRPGSCWVRCLASASPRRSPPVRDRFLPPPLRNGDSPGGPLRPKQCEVVSCRYCLESIANPLARAGAADRWPLVAFRGRRRSSVSRRD